MHTYFKPFSLMGLPKKVTSTSHEDHTFLSEKDLHAILKCDFFEELHSKEEPVRSEAEKSVVSVSVLKIKLPSAGADHGGEADHGGCRTPTAVDQEKINNINIIPLKCPPPPRKPKSLPSTKRKTHDRVLLDLSSEIESLFPPNLLRDFVCGKIKKVRKESTAFK